MVLFTNPKCGRCTNKLSFQKFLTAGDTSFPLLIFQLPPPIVRFPMAPFSFPPFPWPFPIARFPHGSFLIAPFPSLVFVWPFPQCSFPIARFCIASFPFYYGTFSRCPVPSASSSLPFPLDAFNLSVVKVVQDDMRSLDPTNTFTDAVDNMVTINFHQEELVMMGHLIIQYSNNLPNTENF